MLRKLGSVLVLSSVLFASGCFSTSNSGEGNSSNRVSVAHMQPPRSGLTPLSDDAFKLSRWATAETLVQLDEEGNAQPMLATEWEQVNDTTWRFSIRDGVTFHDGTELTAERAAASLSFANEASPRPRILDGVDFTFTADGTDVVVETGEPDPLTPQRLSSPQLSILAQAAYSADTVNPVGHGTGPFELVNVDGTSSATLDKYPDYWGEPAQVDGIDAQFVPDGTARAAALGTGDAHVVEAIPVAHYLAWIRTQSTRYPCLAPILCI